MRAQPFRPDDIDRLRDFAGQEYLVPAFPREDLERVTQSGSHYSFYVGDTLVGCAGVAEANRWRGIAWALLQQNAPQRFVGIHRLTWRLLREQPYQRIEAYVDPTFSPATRWIAMLGFKLEVPYKPYFFPDGRGASEWVFYK